MADAPTSTILKVKNGGNAKIVGLVLAALVAAGSAFGGYTAGGHGSPDDSCAIDMAKENRYRIEGLEKTLEKMDSKLDRILEK